MLRLKNILWIIFGAGLFSFGINYLAIPNHLFEGGVTGVTLITYYLFKLPVSVMNLVINFPLFFFAWKILGKQSFFYSLIGTFSVSAWLAIFEKIPFVVDLDGDLVIVSLIAGIILGAGLGIIFNAGGTTGGSDIIARILNKYTHISIGKLMFAVDFFVLFLVVIVFKDLRLVTYTLVFVFIASGKGFLVVTGKSEELAQAVVEELGRGVTLLNGTGYYTKQDYKVIYCVLARNEMQQMKEIIHRIDPHAFITITEAHEILGEGFTLDENKQPIAR